MTVRAAGILAHGSIAPAARLLLAVMVIGGAGALSPHHHGCRSVFGVANVCAAKAANTPNVQAALGKPGRTQIIKSGTHRWRCQLWVYVPTGYVARCVVIPEKGSA